MYFQYDASFITTIFSRPCAYDDAFVLQVKEGSV